MDMIFALDRLLFLQINQLPHNTVTDPIARFLSGIGEMGAVWFVMAVILFIREEKLDHWFFAPITAALGVGMILSEFVLKNIVARPRPAADFGAIVVSAAGNYSFPSTHATLAFAGAYILARTDPGLRPVFYGLAVLISLSRIYLGVHYPLDIFAGACLGVLIGKCAVLLEPRKPQKNKRVKQ